MHRAVTHATSGAILALLFAVATATSAPPEWQFRAAAGAQFDDATHGVFDIGARLGAFSVELLTDTLEVKLAPEHAWGRWWIAARGELGAAGLFISPWTAGAPDPTRALAASYAGVEGGAAVYLPGGTYAGVEGSARRWFFGARDTTMIPVPEDRFVFRPAVIAGWYTRPFHAWVRAGLDVDGEHTSPTASVEAVLRPDLWIAPWLELRAGWAHDPTDVTRTRLGGINPYVVPLAGAGWAELWVAKYAAIRVGPSVTIDNVRVALVADGALFDGRDAYGLAFIARVTFGAFFGEVTAGWAPELERGPRVSRASAWMRAGFDWFAL